MSIKQKPEYNKFAQFDDATMGDMEEKVEFLRSLIAKHKPETKTVLELACGTGLVIRGLSSYYDVAGLDLSPSMVEVAKEKLPDVDIRVEDMTDFDFGKQFDVVLCVFDSINHLLKWEMWGKTFKQASKHLNENGLFILDMNTEEKLKRHAHSPEWVKRLDGNILFMKVSEENGVFPWHVSIFEKIGEELYQLHEETVHEVAFPREDVQNALKKDFELLEVVNKDGTKPDGVQRPFFVCRKK